MYMVITKLRNEDVLGRAYACLILVTGIKLHCTYTEIKAMILLISMHILKKLNEFIIKMKRVKFSKCTYQAFCENLGRIFLKKRLPCIIENL